MPGGGKFKYEFNQGELWLHEELNAPFDFPLYKSETELQDEHARVVKSSLNYFVLDSLVVEKQLALLKERIDRDNNQQEFALVKFVFELSAPRHKKQYHNRSEKKRNAAWLLFY